MWSSMKAMCCWQLIWPKYVVFPISGTLCIQSLIVAKINLLQNESYNFVIPITDFLINLPGNFHIKSMLSILKRLISNSLKSGKCQGDLPTSYILYFFFDQWQRSKSFVTNHKAPALLLFPYQSWSRVFSNTTAVMVLTTNIGFNWSYQKLATLHNL